MITFDQFITKWNGKFCEVAGTSAQNQCVDLANAYIREVLEQPIIEWTNAVDFPSKAGDKYTYIVNTPTGVPQRGDIVIWKPTPGHIAIFNEGNVNTFRSFDQNFPVGSKCHIQDHNYTNVTGWLRLKPQDTLDSLRKQRDDNWNLYNAEKAKNTLLENENLELKLQLQTEKATNQTLNAQNLQLQNQLKIANDKISQAKTVLA